MSEVLQTGEQDPNPHPPRRSTGTRVTIDLAMFPHIGGLILQMTDWKDLLPWRLTSKLVCAQVDRLMTSHVIMVDGPEHVLLKSPKGRIPVLRDFVYNRHSADSGNAGHGRPVMALSKTTILDLYLRKIDYEGGGKPSEPFENLKYMRLHAFEGDDITRTAVMFPAQTLVTFGDMGLLLQSQVTFRIKVIPADHIPSCATKLVINIKFQTVTRYHVDAYQSVTSDTSLLHDGLREVVLVFSNWGRPVSSSFVKKWPAVVPANERCLWVVMMVITAIVRGRSKVTIVDLHKVDFHWLFGMTPPKDVESPHQAALLQAIHPEARTSKGISMVRGDADWLPKDYAPWTHLLSQLDVSALEFLTLEEYGLRLTPEDLELEIQEFWGY
ncbi:uncharacterized protein EHS24_001698 [Apiotrichum porosum]|uniref:Uncharacterized protein n=1 Tax=Apiotrichum porosum TaxID=105984 RepID=A0A427XIU8_9TREE|nr:uncharacterized protein EHS24_001698 [Apiotrichum porosum]RSH78790.1 hypothetical protein EHS24_001698 [Apiotrichum porosum]